MAVICGPAAKPPSNSKARCCPGLGGAGLNAYTAGLPQGLETFMFLFDTDTGALAAVMEVLYFDWLKTAALSEQWPRVIWRRPAARRLALFGTGRHARSQLYALTQVAADQTRRRPTAATKTKRRAFCDSECPPSWAST